MATENNFRYSTSNVFRESYKMETELLKELSKSEKDTLLSKYCIPINHLDYDYIRSCENVKELEKILEILRSNEEGHFPQLTEFAEKRLEQLKPKSKLLRTDVPVVSMDRLDVAEKEEIKADLKEFVDKMNDFDSELISRGKFSGVMSEIRQVDKEVQENKKTVPKRIKSTDYASWESYDVDAECLKLDLEEEKLKKVVKQTANIKKTVVKPIMEFSTNAEAEFEASQENFKGNESYKNADYEQAIEHYTNAIEIKPISKTYTNRAMANIKIKNFGHAIEDCHAALNLDKRNTKAYVRLAEVYEVLNKFIEALENIDNALMLEPNNITVQNIAARLEKHRLNKNKLRYKIEEEDEDPDSAEEYEVPIPGTSNMKPPFVIMNNKNHQRLNKEVPMVHFVNIDNVEEEECTVNHLEHRCSKKNKTTPIESKENVRPSIAMNKNHCETGGGDAKKIMSSAAVEKDEIRLQKKDNTLEYKTPFTFLVAWNSASKDNSHKQKAMILNRINPQALNYVIGNKLDYRMLSDILHCLRLHFLNPQFTNRVNSILSNLTENSRFNILKMFLTRDDLENVKVLINFLNKYQHPLNEDIKNKYM